MQPYVHTESWLMQAESQVGGHTQTDRHLPRHTRGSYTMTPLPNRATLPSPATHPPAPLTWLAIIRAGRGQGPLGSGPDSPRCRRMDMRVGGGGAAKNECHSRRYVLLRTLLLSMCVVLWPVGRGAAGEGQSEEGWKTRGCAPGRVVCVCVVRDEGGQERLASTPTTADESRNCLT